MIFTNRELDHIVGIFRRKNFLPGSKEHHCPEATAEERRYAVIGLVCTALMALFALAAVISALTLKWLTCVLCFFFALVFVVGFCYVDNWFRDNAAAEPPCSNEEVRT